jgi:type I restriction enzyme S subunit
MQDLLSPKESWMMMSLGGACNKGGGSIQTGPFGSQLHSSDYREEGIPIITVEHLGDNEIIHSNLPLVGKEDYLKLSKYKIVTGDLVFSRVGAIDRCVFVSDNENGWLFSGRCLRVRPGRVFDSRFLSYLMNSYSSRQWILNNAVGSTMKCLNTTILSSLPISFPSLKEQRKIGEDLIAIDNQINSTKIESQKLGMIKQGLIQDLLTGKVRVKYE